MSDFLRALDLGARRRWRQGVAAALSVMGAVWLITEVLARATTSADQWLDDHGNLYLVCVLVASAFGFAIRVFERRRVEFDLPTTGSRLVLKYCDLWDQPGDILIGVNECFDVSLGRRVSPDSLHGQFIQRVYNGDSGRLKSDLEKALRGSAPLKGDWSDGSARYPLGTTAVIHRGASNIYLVALARSDVETGKASSTVAILWDALQEAFSKVVTEGDGRPLSLPLVGNGRSSVNLPPQNLLRVIALAIVDTARRSHMPNVTVALHDDCFEKLDLIEIKRDWRPSGGLS